DGNKKAIFATHGASNHSIGDREGNDYYATDPITIAQLFSQFKELSKDCLIWECACGEGSLSKELINEGYKVVSTDLIDREYGIGGGRLPTSRL
ncbi:MAG: hypothetical protein ACRC0V_05070, partial [Fusobacteriaceae bacterium]